MSVTADGIIGSPVNQADVQSALGVSSSVNNWSALLTHTNINKWSAYKPLYASKITKLTDAERASGAHTVSGYSASYGMLKRVSAQWSDFLDNYGNIKSFPWIYDKPVWDGTCKFRITDYVGYHHNVGRIINITFNAGNEMWIPSAAGSTGSSVWIQLRGLSPVGSENTGAMRWQELFGDCLDYYPTVIMTAGTSWVYAKSSDYTIRTLISIGNTGATIYVNTATLAAAMVTDGASYDSYPLSNNANWNMCMVLCSRKITGGTGKYEHDIRDGSDNILRCEYESGLDRTIKIAKLLKYKAFASMKMQVTLVKESGASYKYRIDKLVIIAEKLTEDAVSFNCNATFTAQVGKVNVTGKGESAEGAAFTVNDYFGTINFAADEVGTVSKTWEYNGTSGNAIPHTTYDVYKAQSGSGDRQVYGRFAFTAKVGSTVIGTFSGGWTVISVKNQDYQYYQEFNLF